MKFSDLLRKAADIIDTDTNQDCGNDEQIMMTPQTQELELMKKMANEPNVFDGTDQTQQDLSAEIGDDQTIATIKRLAGI
jgi:hypothetical protein